MKIKLLLKAIYVCPLLLLMQGAGAQPFNQKLVVPPLYTSPTNSFNITVSGGTYNFYPSQTAPTGTGADTLNFNVAIPALGYNGSAYLGPTMVWKTGQQLTVNQTNNLNMRTTIHWHGLNLPAHLDGGPQEPIDKNGGTFNTSFPVIDQVQTCWYHSHLMDSTTYQVIKGLAGMILVEEPNDLVRAILPHSYDTNDFPIIIQDKGFIFGPRSGNSAPVIALDTAGGGSLAHPGNGQYTFVNGVMNGYLKVPKGIVRLRFLNGSYRKTFQVAIGNNIVPTSFQPMYLVATDGGYTQTAMAMDSLVIGPGERYEMLVDFSSMAHNQTVYLSNRGASLPAAGKNGAIGYVLGAYAAQGKNAFMSFVVDTSMHPSFSPLTVPPGVLRPYVIDTSNVFRYRTKVLGNDSSMGGKDGMWTINGDTMDMERINDTLLVNTKEIWEIENATNVYHPFHIHKIQFQILDIRDTSGNILQSYTNNTLPRNWRGYKDDALIPPYRIVRFIASFDSFPSPMIDPMYAFMYHCHILPHEDFAMMQQFVVVDSATYYGAMMGVPKPVAMGSFTMYPNPAGSTLNLQGNTTQAGTLRIMDVVGRTLREQTIRPFSGSTPVQVGDLPRGFVFVEWTSGSDRYVQRIYLK